jgi:hypothetical protein
MTTKKKTLTLVKVLMTTQEKDFDLGESTDDHSRKRL